MKHLIYLLMVILLFLVNSCEEDDMIVQSLLDLSGAPLEYDGSDADLHLNVAAGSWFFSPWPAFIPVLPTITMSIGREF